MTAIAVCGLALAYPGAGSGHEPVTTKVMFNKEVIRILEENCISCHGPGGIKADIPLTTYDEARPWAKAIKEEVLEKRMKPYQAVRGYGQFSHDYSIPQREVDMLVSWIEGGAPRGDLKEYPESLKKRLDSPGEPIWEGGKPDLVLESPAPVRIAADGDPVSKCIAIPVSEDNAVRGFDFKPGDGTVVDGAEFYIADKVRGDGCPDPAGAELLGNWVPGQSAVMLPGGASFRMSKGSRVVFRINYRSKGEETTDRSRLGLYLAGKKAGRSARTAAIKTGGVKIPANTSNHRFRTTFKIEETTEALAIQPLIFPHARSLEATALLPNGRAEVLIWVRDYRFDWQPTYYFRDPISLPAGTRIVVTAYFNNSESNRYLSTDPSSPLEFNGELCRLTLTDNQAARQARR